MKRPGNWNAFLVALALGVAWAKWLAKRFAFWTSPVMMLIAFVCTRYEHEIDELSKRFKLWLFGSRHSRVGLV